MLGLGAAISDDLVERERRLVVVVVARRAPRGRRGRGVVARRVAARRVAALQRRVEVTVRLVL